MKQHLLLLLASLPSAHGALLSSRRPLPSSCRAGAARALLGFGEGSSPPQTVDEARQKFFAAYGKPYVAPDAQGFVNELLGSSQMAIVSPSFRYNAVFALGTEALCETFLAQRPEAERVAITDAIITALGMSPQQLKSDAAALRETAKAAGTEEALLGSKPMLEIKAYPKVSQSVSVTHLLTWTWRTGPSAHTRCTRRCRRSSTRTPSAPACSHSCPSSKSSRATTPSTGETVLPRHLRDTSETPLRHL